MNCQECDLDGATPIYCSKACRVKAYLWKTREAQLTVRREPGSAPCIAHTVSDQLDLDEHELDLSNHRLDLEAERDADYLALKALCIDRGGVKSVWQYQDDALDFWPRNEPSTGTR